MNEPPLYVRISEGEPLPDISPYRPFRAVLVIDGTYSAAWQEEVSRWLVESGCLYMMAWGPGCSSWDDSVDWANIDQFRDAEVPDESFVMTTWHEGEPLDDVFWFSHFCAHHGDVEIAASLIVHISERDQRQEMISRYIAAEHQEC